MNIMRLTNLKEDLKKSIPNIDNFEPELFKSFITYWSIRKSGSLATTNVINELKINNSKDWIALIESNQKFRTLYGEATAEELIKVIKLKSA